MSDLLQNLKAQVLACKQKVKSQESDLDLQRKNLVALQRTISLLESKRKSASRESDSEEDEEDDSGDEDASRDGSESDGPESDESSTIDVPVDDTSASKMIWDNADQVVRCATCAWEVCDNMCQGCGEEFSQAEVLNNASQMPDTISTASEAFTPDRVPCARRGTTPLRRTGAVNSQPDYVGHETEYKELLRRGATPLMCETFHLEYAPEHGIIAWADQDIFDEFSGPDMRTGDHWKIYLGRRIILAEEDYDGSMFLEGLLEDALVFPLRNFCRWETVLEGTGLWASRLVNPTKKGEDDDQDMEDEGEDEEDEKNEEEEDDEYSEDEAHRYERLMENHDQIFAGPVRTVEAQEYEDDTTVVMHDHGHARRRGCGADECYHGEDCGMAMDEDPGFAEPDAAWESDGYGSDDEVQIVNPRIPDAEKGPSASDGPADGANEGTNKDAEDDVEMVEDDEDSGSEPGSDFDSDENLSGDEEVMGLGAELKCDVCEKKNALKH